MTYYQIYCFLQVDQTVRRTTKFLCHLCLVSYTEVHTFKQSKKLSTPKCDILQYHETICLHFFIFVESLYNIRLCNIEFC